MEQFPYRGTWVACGAYAFVQAAGLREDLLLEVENCAGATYGMKSCGREWDYTRILTPYKDFNNGIDEAAHLWGITIRHEVFETKESFCPESIDPEAKGIVIGPVNMTGLNYLVLPQQYHMADHFFAVLRKAEGKYVLYDSEGIAGMNVETGQIRKWLNIEGIPEANNKIHVRMLYGEGKSVEKKGRINYEIQISRKNFRLAEQSNQGADAFLICKNVIEEDLPLLAKWRESFIYNMNYVVQRRLMMLRFLEKVGQTEGFSVDGRLNKLIMRQIKTVGKCVYDLECANNSKLIGGLDLLFKMETELTHGWEEWIKWLA